MLRSLSVRLFCWILVALALIVGVSDCAAASFSADIKIGVASERFPVGWVPGGTWKLYVSGDRVRLQESPQRDSRSWIINTHSLEVLCLYPRKRGYLDIASGPDRRRFYRGAIPDEGREILYLDELLRRTPMAEIKHLGHERVNGYVCDRYIDVVRGRTPGSTSAWFSKKLGVVVKSVKVWDYLRRSGGTAPTSTAELAKIRERSLSPSLFEVPKGYRKLGPLDFRVGRLRARARHASP
jgi:hypothetical protein